MLQEETRKDKKMKAGLIGAAVMLLTLGAGCAAEKPGTPTDEAPQPTPAPITAPPTSGATSYKDGEYTAQGTYAFHSGSETVNIMLKLKDGVVVDTTFQSVPSNGMSERFQKMFSDNYKPMVVGKSLDEVCALGKVSGSSLTPKGFDEACAKIQIQAKA